MADEHPIERPPATRRPSFTDRLRGPTDDPLVALLDDAVADTRRTALAQRTLRREAGRTLAAWAALLAGAADTATPVVVETTDGSRHAGVVELAGHDVVVLRRGDELLLLAGDHVRALRTDGTGALGDGRSAATSRPVSLRDLLARCAQWRAPVVLRLVGGGDPVCGTLWSCGEDLCSVRTDAVGERVHVPLRAIREAVVPRG